MFETIRDVLVAAGWELGHEDGVRWRTRCPVHRGENRTAFSYTPNVWTCFAGCGSGGIGALVRALGLTPPPPRPTQQVVGMHFEPIKFVAPKVSEQLAARWRVQVRERRQEAEERHRWALSLLRDIDDHLEVVRWKAAPHADGLLPYDLEQRWQHLGQAWVESMQHLRRAHAELVVLAWAARLDPVLGFEPCAGSCYSRGDDPRDKLTPDLFADVSAWVARQDDEFQGMVTKFLEDASGSAR